MAKITFYADYQGLIENFCLTLLSKEGSSLFLFQDGKDLKVKDKKQIEDVFENLGYPNKYWYLHGEIIDGHSYKPKNINHILYQPRLYEEIKSTYKELADSFVWSIFPSGGYDPYDIYCFVENNDGHGMITKALLQNSEKFQGMLVKEYILDNFELPYFQSVIFREKTAGSALWDSLNFKNNLPIIASATVENMKGLLSILKETNKIDENQEANILDCFLFSINIGNSEFGIYKPTTKETFLVMSNLFYKQSYEHESFPDPPVLILADNSKERISEVIKIIAKECENDELYATHFEQLLDLTEWMCLPSSSLSEDQYIWFLTNKSSDVDNLCKNNTNVELITCF